MHVHTSEYTFGDIVYLRTDPDQFPRIITKVGFDPTGIVYELTFTTQVTQHYQIEFTREVNITFKTGGGYTNQ